MKYSEFDREIKKLGDKYSVHYQDYYVTVSYKGEWVGTVSLSKRYSYRFQQAWDGYWGSEKLRWDCTELIHQLSKTKPKNRGKLPVDVKSEYQRLVLV